MTVFSVSGMPERRVYTVGHGGLAMVEAGHGGLYLVLAKWDSRALKSFLATLLAFSNVVSGCIRSLPGVGRFGRAC